MEPPSYDSLPAMILSNVVFPEPFFAIKAEYEQALLNPVDDDHFNELLTKMETYEAWDYETRIKQVLGKLKIHNFDQKVENLSGGQLKRVALANVLITEPELLILDEPTNHLDLEMVEWLEEFLTRSKMALLMVTHDRYFLDRVCSEVRSKAYEW